MDDILSRNMNAMVMGQTNRGREQRVFDWDKAAEIIRDQRPQEADAGLSEDWYWTAASILENGKPAEHEYGGPWCASTWATPVLRINDEDIECWRMASTVPPEWGSEHSHVYWPASALAIAFPDGKPALKLESSEP